MTIFENIMKFLKTHDQFAKKIPKNTTTKNSENKNN